MTNVKKTYASGAVGVSGVDFTIADREFTVVLGESGSGKSSLARVICGLDDLTEGEIAIDGKVVNDLQPKDRDIALVVKSAGLYPNLNVFDNLSYGLKLRKTPKEELEDRTYEVARILGLTDVLSRKPKNISALERQRVCIGRAFARRPKLIILDDPFTDFGDEARKTLCEDVFKLQKRSGINFIYFTKNPAEALALADRIIYLEKGKVVCADTPENVYDSPSTLALARLVGFPPINVFTGCVADAEGLKFSMNGYLLELDESLRDGLKDYIGTGRKLQLAVRPEDVSVGEKVYGVLEEIETTDKKAFVGFSIYGDSSAHYAVLEKDFVFRKGAEQGFAINLKWANFFDLETEKNILKQS